MQALASQDTPKEVIATDSVILSELAHSPVYGDKGNQTGGLYKCHPCFTQELRMSALDKAPTCRSHLGHLQVA